MTDEWAGKIAAVIRKRKQIAGAMLNIIRILKKGGAGMTENEAIECLKCSKRKNDMLGILPGSDIGNTIIKALEEIQQYRAIGTVEELQDMKSNYFEALSDWRQYRKIGTLEECRAAVEKQTAKKGIREKIKKGYNRGMHHYYCPVCYEKGDLRNKYNVGLYCSDCGQKLDWEDEK